MAFNIKRIWGAPLLTNLGMVMMAIAFLNLFTVPFWYWWISGALILSGTAWWLVTR